MPRRTCVLWPEAWRIVPSRFPPRGVSDRIASPEELDALYAIEALTNARLREELGQLAMVPRERRVSGPGTQPLMAAFTLLNPDGSYGVFYAARSIATARPSGCSRVAAIETQPAGVPARKRTACRCPCTSGSSS